MKCDKRLEGIYARVQESRAVIHELDDIISKLNPALRTLLAKSSSSNPIPSAYLSSKPPTLSKSSLVIAEQK